MPLQLVERKFPNNLSLYLIKNFKHVLFSLLSRYGVQAAIKTRGRREAGGSS
jgi:hypothetical protein